MGWKVLQGDVREKLQEIPEKSVQCVVTSPPYFGLRSYLTDGHSDKQFELGAENTPEEYVANMIEVFRGVWRVLRDDGTVWLNLGSSMISKTIESNEMILRSDLTKEEVHYVLEELAKHAK